MEAWVCVYVVLWVVNEERLADVNVESPFDRDEGAAQRPSKE